MCGIVFKLNFDKHKPVNNDILQQYDQQSHRGQQGFGIFDGQHMNIVRESREDNILKWLCRKDSNFILFHHRFPTSTVNVARAAHPFNTKDYFGDTQYILVHNGIIRNADTLWVEHHNLGIRYTSLLEDLSFNDSEALLWDLALTMEGKQEKMKAYGDIAFIMMKTVKGKLVDMRFGRNVRPLNALFTDETVEISSEGNNPPIQQDTLYTYNFKKRDYTMAPMTFPQYKPFKYTVPAYPPVNSTCSQLQLPAATDETHFDSYDDWWNHKYGGITSDEKRIQEREANWQRLRAKYGKHIDLSEDVSAELRKNKVDAVAAKSIGKILEARKTGKDSFIVEVKHEDMRVDVDSIDLRDYEPMSNEVQNCAMEYMIEAQGNFEDAYGLLENAYAEFIKEVSGKETFGDVRQQLLMEKAMEFINSDPEYENEKSISSIWEALWYQRTQTA